MSRTLYVRTFNDSIHDKLSDLSQKQGVTVGSIIEDAVIDWMKQKHDIPAKHHLVFYADKDSLLNFLRKIEELTKEDWTKVCLGPESLEGKKFLKKKNWIDVTISPYVQGIKSPEKYSGKVFDKVAKEARGKKTVFMGFMTGDVAQRFSLKKANELERIANSKIDSGVTFCPYDISKTVNSSMSDLLQLIDEHDKTFILRKNEIFELNLGKTNHSKLLL